MAGEKGSTGNFKVLIPRVTATLMTANNGGMRQEIERITGAQIKISKRVFPGTDEKVLLISGKKEDILHANVFVLEAVNQAIGAYCTTFFDPRLQVAITRENQVKILIPQTSAGRIIGKQGKNIEMMKQHSGAFIFLPYESYASELLERCVSVAGDILRNDIACRMLFEHFVQYSDVDYYLNIEYTGDSNLPIIFPYGPLFPNLLASPVNAQTSSTDGHPGSQLVSTSQHQQNPGIVNTLSLSDAVFNQVLETMRTELSVKGYPNTFIRKVTKSVRFLHENKIVSLCVTVPMNVDDYAGTNKGKVAPYNMASTSRSEDPVPQSKKTGAKPKKQKRQKRKKKLQVLSHAAMPLQKATTEPSHATTESEQ